MIHNARNCNDWPSKNSQSFQTTPKNYVLIILIGAIQIVDTVAFVYSDKKIRNSNALEFLSSIDCFVCSVLPAREAKPTCPNKKRAASSGGGIVRLAKVPVRPPGCCYSSRDKLSYRLNPASSAASSRLYWSATPDIPHIQLWIGLRYRSLWGAVTTCLSLSTSTTLFKTH